MKKVFMTIAMMLMVVFASFAQDVTKEVKISKINGINASYIFDVTVVKKNKCTLKLTLDPELEEYVKVSELNGILILKIDRERLPKKLRNDIGDRVLKAEVTMPSLERLILSGASKFTTEDTFEVADFKGEFSGASKVFALSINGSEAEFDISGASKAEFSGKIKDLSCEISGASDVTMFMESTDADYEISGASTVDIEGNFSEIDIECSGASRADLKGNAGRAKYNASGASKIDAEDMKAKYVSVSASGASKIEAKADVAIKVSLSGSSSLTYSAPEGVFAEIGEVGRSSYLKRR